MKTESHIKRSKKEFGVEARDIHEWIDGMFDHAKFHYFVNTGIRVDGFNPYDHRVHRHCVEAEAECVEQFKDRYPDEVIRAVFEQHIRDDYDGYYPNRDDYDDKAFHEKYHNR